MHIRKIFKAASIALALSLSGLMPSIAVAQTGPSIEPMTKEEPVTPEGINLATGTFQFTTPGVSVGQGDFPSKLTFTRKMGSVGPGVVDSHNIPYVFLADLPAGPYSYEATLVSFQGKQHIFVDNSGGTYNNFSQDGSTLRFTSIGGSWTYSNYSTNYGAPKGFFTFTDKDGFQLKIDTNPTSYCNHRAWCAQSVQAPDGSFAKYDYTDGRINKISNSLGYAISFTRNAQGTLSSVSASASCTGSVAINCSAGTMSTESYTYTTVPFTYPNYNGQPLTLYVGVIDSVRDSSNRATTLGYTNASLSSIRYPENPGANAAEITYSSPDIFAKVFVTSYKNGAGKVTLFSYNNGTYPSADGSESLTTVIDPLSQQSSYYFGYSQELSYYRDPLGNTRTYTYDGGGPVKVRLREILEPSGAKEIYGYDDRANVISRTRQAPGQANRVTSIGYPTCDGSNFRMCNRPSYVIDERAYRTDFQYDPAHGGLTVVLAPADAAGKRAVTRYNYGTFYPAPGVVNPPNLSVAVASLKTSEDTCLSSSVTGTTIDFNFVCPASDRVRTAYNITASTSASPAIAALESVTIDSGGLNLTARYVWDKVGNKISEDGPQVGTADTTTFAYDADRRLTQITAPTVGGVSSVTQLVYDNNGRQTQTKRLLNGGWVTETVSYDLDNRKTSATGADGVSEYYSYDDDGRLRDTTRTVDGVARVTRNLYDAADRVTQVRKAVGTSLEQAYVTWTYSSTGQKLSEQDANGNTTTACYDGFDRLVELRFPAATSAPGAAPTCAAIGAGGGLPTGTTREVYGYDAAGNMTALTRRGASTPIAMSYDALGRMVLKDVPEANRDVSYGYDLLGRRTAASYPAANAALSVAWSYDKAGRVTAESSDGRALTHGYAADASWSDLAWPDGYAVRTALDAQARVSSVQELGGPVLAGYGYDGLARRVSVTRGNGAATSYGWDAQQRLGSLGHAISGGAVAWGFGYNEASQIRTLSGNNDAYAWTGGYNVNRPYGVNALNQYTSSGSLTLDYDARGNLTGDGVNAYAYDSDNRLTDASGARTATLAYDAIGRLARVTSGGSVTRFAYDAARLVAEYDAAGTLLRRHVHGGGVDEPIVTVEGGTRRWLYADRQGSIVATADAGGALVRIDSYDEYGVPGAGNAGRFGYTGQANIAELGLQYYKARIYSATLGRFLQTDPVGTADQVNLYAYVGNDPLNNSDPSGEDICPLGGKNCADNPGASSDPIPLPKIDPPKEKDVAGTAQRQTQSGSSSGTWNPVTAWRKAHQIGEQELARTRKLAPSGGHNDVYDAERHARWTYRMAKEIGPRWSDLFSGAREDVEELPPEIQPSREYFMDTHNNLVGIKAAQGGRPIPNIHTPGLIYIRPDGDYYAQ